MESQGRCQVQHRLSYVKAPSTKYKLYPQRAVESSELGSYAVFFNQLMARRLLTGMRDPSIYQDGTYVVELEPSAPHFAELFHGLSHGSAFPVTWGPHGVVSVPVEQVDKPYPVDPALHRLPTKLSGQGISPHISCLLRNDPLHPRLHVSPFHPTSGLPETESLPAGWKTSPNNPFTKGALVSYNKSDGTTRQAYIVNVDNSASPPQYEIRFTNLLMWSRRAGCARGSKQVPSRYTDPMVVDSHPLTKQIPMADPLLLKNCFASLENLSLANGLDMEVDEPWGAGRNALFHSPMVSGIPKTFVTAAPFPGGVERPLGTTVSKPCSTVTPSKTTTAPPVCTTHVDPEGAKQVTRDKQRPTAGTLKVSSVNADCFSGKIFSESSPSNAPGPAPPSAVAVAPNTVKQTAAIAPPMRKHIYAKRSDPQVKNNVQDESGRILRIDFNMLGTPSTLIGAYCLAQTEEQDFFFFELLPSSLPPPGARQVLLAGDFNSVISEESDVFYPPDR
ncbi:hypothetical protein CEUSTIGMA_g10476.t1 [Chlamydomonas eustigma]|uniref:Endonuclease/exonuclease/phosphatase domain-containing protein n=1 Tax=Chlamydomonas eustigma TaxID=1157962 RepID=A0A250XJS1_9CHLO|nr:hypothetical protein CEUSTIGMA_g10476.t1 [Chlamydomonas eustigma]|eukprot:GAX83050.1 hypothetical protein CEUSTIGMA_g10476.t1 [Chlamydomonas eustigma]